MEPRPLLVFLQHVDFTQSGFGTSITVKEKPRQSYKIDQHIIVTV